MPADCNTCSHSLSGLTFRCHGCQSVQHLHQARIAHADAGVVLAIKCPACGAFNACRKPNARVVRGDPILVLSAQEEMKL